MPPGPSGSAIRPVRSRCKSAVRFPEDSEIGNNLKEMGKGRYSEDDDYVAYKNVDPLKQKENGIGKRRSAQEAAKKLNILQLNILSHAQTRRNKLSDVKSSCPVQPHFGCFSK